VNHFVCKFCGKGISEVVQLTRTSGLLETSSFEYQKDSLQGIRILEMLTGTKICVMGCERGIWKDLRRCDRSDTIEVWIWMCVFTYIILFAFSQGILVRTSGCGTVTFQLRDIVQSLFDNMPIMLRVTEGCQITREPCV
jgi:hypothetical protein